MKRGYYFFGLWLFQPFLLVRSEPGGFAHTVDSHILSTFFVKRPEIWQKNEYKTERYFHTDQPDNIHFIPVGTSVEWHHYRHQVNIQLQYQAAKWLGIPDSTIHTFLGECFACDPRNRIPGSLYFEESHQDDINNPPQAGTAGSFLVPFKSGLCTDSDAIRFISGQRRSYSPNSRILKSTAQSYVHLFFSGHGSYGILKFKDFYEVSSYVLGEAIARLKIKDQFQKMFILIDSCQALTMADYFLAPQTFVVASSAGGSHAYSCNEDSDVGVALMDRMSYLMADFFRRLDMSGANITMQQFFGGMDPGYLMSQPVNDTSLIHHSLDQEWLTDWFAAPEINMEIRKLRGEHGNSKELPFQPAPKYRRIRQFPTMVRQSVLADALKAIVNAEKAAKTQVLIRPSSKVVVKFLRVMQKHGYIGEFEIIDDARSGKIAINLLGRLNKCAAISPRYDVSIKELEKLTSKLLPSRQFGFVVLTTSAGIMDHEQAKKQHQGGKILGFFF